MPYFVLYNKKKHGYGTRKNYEKRYAVLLKNKKERL